MFEIVYESRGKLISGSLSRERKANSRPSENEGCDRTVLLYWSLSVSNTSIYLLVELAEKYLNIFSLIVLFHILTTHVFSSFSVEYSSTSFLTSLL